MLIIMASMLIACLLDMPYGYYQIVRFISMVVFAYLAYEYYKLNNVVISYMFVALALLFQPFMKVSLGRTIWNIVDVVVAIMLFGLLFLKEKEKR